MQLLKRGSLKDVDMLSGKILPEMVKFAIPIILTGALQQFYNAADAIIVGNFGGKEALAAVGASASIINLLITVVLNFFVGTNILVARSIGSGDDEKLKKTISTTYVVTLVLGFTLMISGQILTVPMLEATGCPENIFADAEKYLRIYLLGTPATFFMNFSSSVIRNSGDSTTPFKYMSISGVSNVLCNILFVLIFGDPVASVAIATVVSMMVSAILFFIKMTRMDGAKKLHPFRIDFNGSILRQTIFYGIPAIISSVSYSLTNVIIQPAINAYGDVGISGSIASNTVESFFYVITGSFLASTLTFLGQNIGADKRDRVVKILKTAYIFSFSLSLFLSLIAIIFGKSILYLFIPGEEEAIEFAMSRFIIVAAAMPLQGIMNVNGGAAQAYGKTLLQMVSNLIGVCCFRILWMVCIYPYCQTPTMLWICYPISWICTSVILFCIVVHLTKKYVSNKSNAQMT